MCVWTFVLTGGWCCPCSLYWMKDVTKSDLRKRNPQDRRHLSDDEIDSIHLANIACAFCC